MSNPDADSAARVTAWLREKGVDPATIEDAVVNDMLHVLVIDRMVLPDDPCYTGAEVADLTGLPLEHVRRLWRALGFPDVADADRVFGERDVQALTSLHGLLYLRLTDEDQMVQLTRVIGSSMARIAEAEVDASPVLRQEATSVEMAELYMLAADAILPDIARLLEYAWRRHLQAAIRRAALRRQSGMGPGGVVEMAIGFADLVGFTALSQQLSEGALAEVVDRFEEVSYDTVGRLGGRVVKMIGDEAMFAVNEAADAASIALALSEAYAGDDVLSEVRVGLAYGPVLLRDGDCYGPTVNLASRIVNIAAPGSVVVAESIYSALQDDPRFRWKALRSRYLKDIGRVSLYVLRAAGPDVERPRRRFLVREALREQMERAHVMGRTMLSAPEDENPQG